MIRSLRYK